MTIEQLRQVYRVDSPWTYSQNNLWAAVSRQVALCTHGKSAAVYLFQSNKLSSFQVHGYFVCDSVVEYSKIMYSKLIQGLRPTYQNIDTLQKSFVYLTNN